MNNFSPGPEVCLAHPTRVSLLLLEDSPIGRKSYRRYLQADATKTYHIHEATTLAAGRQLWQSLHLDLILLDINLPDGNGLDLLEEMMADAICNQIPVIVLTGQGDEPSAVRAMKLGAADYLVKSSITAVSLTVCIQQTLERIALSRQLEESQRQAILLAETFRRLKASEQLYASLAAAAPVGIFRVDAQGHCSYVNERYCQLTGLTAAMAAGQGWRQWVHPDDRQAAIETWQRCMGDNRLCQLECRYQRPDGTVRWVHAQIVAHRHSTGQIIDYIGTLTDINDYKQAEAALRESEATNQAILSAIPDLMVRISQDGIYRGFVHTCQEIDIIPETLNAVGLPVKEVLPAHLAERQLHYVQQALKTGELQIFEQQVVIGDHTQHEEVRVMPSKPDEVLLIIRDISQRKQAEAERLASAQLQHTNQELERATRLKDEFLANMSHELRTPLNAILGMCEGLQEQVFGPLNQQQHKALNTIAGSGAHLLDLINDILDLSKIESGHMELDLGPVDMAQLCKSSLSFVKQQAFQKQIQLQIVLPPELPGLEADERRIRQVLINLLNNAVKFTPEGGQVTLTVDPHLRVGTAPPAQYLRVTVADTGIGIAAKNLDQLFKPFVQIESALNRNFVGTGLGLALVKRIVELHGGQVWVTSEVGVGSHFSIDLPYRPAPAALPLPVTAGEANSSDTSLIAADTSTHPLILLAEDNEANILTIQSYLAAQGYRLLIARNGQAAIELAPTALPDLILMDIQMPKLDGLTASRILRQQAALAKVPIIALTALAMPGDRERCLAVGINDYFSKPVNLKALAAKIKQLLAVSRPYP